MVFFVKRRNISQGIPIVAYFLQKSRDMIAFIVISPVVVYQPHHQHIQVAFKVFIQLGNKPCTFY